MTTKRNLSSKKTSQQTISIYKSISAFYCTTMENVLKVFEQGKTLIDLKNFPDSELKKLYIDEGRFSLPFIEASAIMGSFMPLDFFYEKQIFFNMDNLVSKNIEPYSIDSINNLFTIVKNRLVQNNLIKDVRWDIVPKIDQKGFDGLIEYSGNYKFLHINNVKYNISLMGLMGLKITDLHYSGEDNYVRLKFTTDKLFFRNQEAMEARTELAKKNEKYITNLFRIIEHGAPHLWQRLSNNNHAIISFRNKEDFYDCLAEVESDLKRYGSKEDFDLDLLKFFEFLHWIKIIDKKELTFQFTVSEDDHKPERELLVGYLSKNFTILEKAQIYYLESKY